MSGILAGWKNAFEFLFLRSSIGGKFTTTQYISLLDSDYRTRRMDARKAAGFYCGEPVAVSSCIVRIYGDTVLIYSSGKLIHKANAPPIKQMSKLMW